MPRWMHHLRARFGGYFWSPCVVCGRMWGGHERPFGILERGATGSGQVYCPRCFTKYGDRVTVGISEFDIRKVYDLPAEMTIRPFAEARSEWLREQGRAAGR